MYILKRIPEDFKVEEISRLDSARLAESGKYLYFRLAKKNMNSIDAAEIIARSVGIKAKDIGIAGLKDKRAISVQWCSAKTGNKRKFADLQQRGKQEIKKIDKTAETKDGLQDKHIENSQLSAWFSIEVMGFGDCPISLGDLQGNKFEIILRNLDNRLDKTIDKTLKNKKPAKKEQSEQPLGSGEKLKFVNYFDEQRFSLNNIEIGRLILHRDYVKAARLIDRKSVADQLKKEDNNGIGALRTTPLRLLRVYVQAYQSYLWNKTVSRLILASYKHQRGAYTGLGNNNNNIHSDNTHNNSDHDNNSHNCSLKSNDQTKTKKVKQLPGMKFIEVGGEKLYLPHPQRHETKAAEDENPSWLNSMDAQIPLIGFTTESEKFRDGLRETIGSIMHEENINFHDFVITALPELSCEGGYRTVWAEADELWISEPAADEFFKGKLCQKIKFRLERGSYATMLIKYLLAGKYD